MTNTLTADVLTERRALIIAVDTASAAYAAACRGRADAMGLIGKHNRPEAEYLAWRAAERDLAAFYAQYPISVHKKAFAAESRTYRGRK